MKYSISLLIAFLILTLHLNCKKVGKAEAPILTKEVNESLSNPKLDFLKLPTGFSIDYYAKNIENARSLSMSPKGTLFVGNRGGDKVYAVRDEDGDHFAETTHILLEGGNMPNGVVFHEGDLYVAEVNRILVFEDIESKLENPGEPKVIYDKFPTEKHHGWKYIDIGPDGKLYVPVGAPCNICESDDPVFASITRMDLDGSNMEIVHSGIRNTVGLTWHPKTKELWSTDNNRDHWGDDRPACELNRATRDGMHFGYPYCHQGDLLDDEFGEGKDCADYEAPVQNLGPHCAPLGIEFSTSNMFPIQYKNDVAFIAEHGSWNRTKKIGYQISMVQLDKNHQSKSYEPFIKGWVDHESQEVFGRPVDLEWMSDGSMLISDDFSDCVYRVVYSEN